MREEVVIGAQMSHRHYPWHPGVSWRDGVLTTVSDGRESIY